MPKNIFIRLIKALPEIILIIFLLYTILFYAERANVEPLWKSWGDTFSDSNVLLAGQHFVERGFFKLYFLPTDLSVIKGAYTGWPPLADITNGILRKIGINDIAGFRYFIILIDVLFILYLYRLLVLLFENKWAALFGTMLVSITPYMYLFSDSLHCHMYEEFFRTALLFYFISYIRTARAYFFILTIIFTFAETYTTWVHIPFMILLFILYPLLFKEEKYPSVVYKNILSFPAAVLAALGLYFVQVALALGGIKPALFNFFERLTVRTADLVTGDYFKGYGSGSFLKGVTFSKYLGMQLERFSGTFVIKNPLAPLASAIAAYLLLFFQKNYKYFKIIIFFLLINLVWLAIFIQHSFIHGFTIRSLGIWLAMLFAFSFKFIFDSFKFKAGDRSFVRLFFAVFLFLVIGAAALDIINNYYNYYVRYTSDLEFRKQYKLYMDLGLENVAYSLGSPEAASTFKSNIQAVLDNQFLLSGPDNPNNYWQAGETRDDAFPFFIDLSNACAVYEINLYCWGKNVEKGKYTARNYDIDFYRPDSNNWEKVVQVRAGKYPKSKSLEGDILKISQPVDGITSNRIRIIFFKDQSSAFQYPQLSEVEIWGKAVSNILGQNIIRNSDFEKIRGGLPVQWEFFAFNPNFYFFMDKQIKISGLNSFLINNTKLNDSYLKQILILSPNAKYIFSGWIKTQNVVSEKASGAHFKIEGEVEVKWLNNSALEGTGNWTEIIAEITTPKIIKPNTKVILECRVGDYGDCASGKAWFDKLSLKRIE